MALIPSSYHPHFGGVEEHTRQVARHLRDQGVEVEVWTPDRGERLGMQNVDGIRVRYLPTPLPARTWPSLASMLLRAPGAAGAWLKAFRQFKPDILHVQCFGPNGTYALALAAAARRPLVISSHGETFMDDHDIFRRSALQRRALTVACGRADVVTGCSTMVAQDLQERFGAGEVKVVPNGVVVEPDTPRLPPSQAGPVVLAAGRLVHKKGFDLLIRAATALRPAVRVQIVGDGPQRSELEEMCERLGVEDKIDFLGRRNSAEVQRLMAQADAVVVPSRVEAFGIVVLEAWASGTPLIATTRGGPADLVTDRVDGCLVDPEDTAQLAKTISRVLEDTESAGRMSAQGLQTVKKFTWDRVVDDYRRLYESLSAV